MIKLLVKLNLIAMELKKSPKANLTVKQGMYLAFGLIVYDSLHFYKKIQRFGMMLRA